MINIVELQIEERNQKIEQIKKVLIDKKEYVVNAIISRINMKMGLNFFYYKIQDIDGNIVDILVNEDSIIYKEYIEKKDILNFNAELLLDNRMFNNEEQIILLDINSTDEYINLEYLCNSLNYKNLSYSKRIIELLDDEIDDILSKKIIKLK